jgi:hypothetical protein
MARGQCGHVVQIVAIECRWCGRWFYRCRRCYHGHRYCGKRCRKAARKAQKDAARQRNIDKDPEAAREDNARRQRDYRDRQRAPPPNVDDGGGSSSAKGQQGRPDTASVTDQGSTALDQGLSPCSEDGARASDRQNGPQQSRPGGRQRCQRCGRWGRVVLRIGRFDRTASFRRLF